MYATLKNNQLITKGHDGEQFNVNVNGPGVYEVKTCYTRGNVVEFGTGLVEIDVYHLEHVPNPPYQLRIFDHTPVILTSAVVQAA